MPGPKAQRTAKKLVRKMVAEDEYAVTADSPIPSYLVTEFEYEQLLGRFNRIEDPKLKRRVRRELKRIDVETIKNRAELFYDMKNLDSFSELNEKHFGELMQAMRPYK